MSLIIIVSEVKPSNIMEKDPKQTQEKLLCSSDTAPTIHSLPGDAVALVARHAPDLETLKNLAAASPLLRKTLFEENLLCCDHCHNALYSDDSLKQPAPHTQPFSCAVCRGKFCGFRLFDYARRSCKPQKCDGCGTIECLDCLQKHTTDEQMDGYGTENYCSGCQEEYEFGMGGC